MNTLARRVWSKSMWSRACKARRIASSLCAVWDWPTGWVCSPCCVPEAVVAGGCGAWVVEAGVRLVVVVVVLEALELLELVVPLLSELLGLFGVGGAG